jgi:hypothetical protein
MLETSKWDGLFQTTDWKGVHCSTFPAVKIEERTGVHSTTISFDPPIPYLVSSKLSKKRFQKEFSETRRFNNIKAKVLSTSNSKISSGRTYSGSVTISPVSPSTSFTDTQGRQQSINASYAYRIEFDFGNYEQTSALGLYKVATYYVRNGKYIAIIVESGISDAPIINFISE